MNYIITTVVTAGIVQYMSPVGNVYNALYVVHATYMALYPLATSDTFDTLPTKGLVKLAAFLNTCHSGIQSQSVH